MFYFKKQPWLGRDNILVVTKHLIQHSCCFRYLCCVMCKFKLLSLCIIIYKSIKTQFKNSVKKPLKNTKFPTNVYILNSP